MYHYTSVENMDAILREGLRFSKLASSRDVLQINYARTAGYGYDGSIDAYRMSAVFGLLAVLAKSSYCISFSAGTVDVGCPDNLSNWQNFGFRNASASKAPEAIGAGCLVYSVADVLHAARLQFGQHYYVNLDKVAYVKYGDLDTFNSMNRWATMMQPELRRFVSEHAQRERAELQDALIKTHYDDIVALFRKLACKKHESFSTEDEYRLLLIPRNVCSVGEPAPLGCYPYSRWTLTPYAIAPDEVSKPADYINWYQAHPKFRAPEVSTWA